MRYLLLVLLVGSISCVSLKNNVRALTESNGQEIIEIGNPKALPPEIEEEPSAEVEDIDIVQTQTTVTTATKTVEAEKLTQKASSVKGMKDVDRIDGVSPDDDEEMRIEKELVDVYKDNSDYKSNDAEEQDKLMQKIDENAGKPIQRSGFKFQPDLKNQAAIDRFRTSVDEIKCDRLLLSVTKPADNPSKTPGGAAGITANIILLTALSFLIKFCH